MQVSVHMVGAVIQCRCCNDEEWPSTEGWGEKVEWLKHVLEHKC